MYRRDWRRRSRSSAFTRVTACGHSHDSAREGARRTSTLLDRVAWEHVNKRVKHEQRNREVYVPPISLFRWWARRPHALIGALIDAAADDHGSPVVSDPFSGGGTVALEAARRGLRLYAQDLHPWAITGLAAALGDVEPDELESAVATVLEALDKRCSGLYATACPIGHDTSELVHIFWVRTRKCRDCGQTSYLYPYSMLTLASRRQEETDAFFGCNACGAISRHQAGEDLSRRCPNCKVLLPEPDHGLLAKRMANCPHPGCGAKTAVFVGEKPTWKIALLYRMCKEGKNEVKHFDIPTAGELEQDVQLAIPQSLRETIPEGVETSLLRRAGFQEWADLYPSRQLATLLAAGEIVDQLEVSETIHSRLRLAVCGAAEMAGFLSRWDRYYPKAFEAMANHRFPALGFACETNLLAQRGRGTLRRRFNHSVAAARWSRDNMSLRGQVRVLDAAARRRRLTSGALLVTGSSERQLPSVNSVDLVLTDPPYFDDVQYAELASLFLVWSRTLRLVPQSVTVDLRSEAVANASRSTGVEGYRFLLTKIFKEARRTLKPEGRLVLTFHNTDIRAWWALSRALRRAGFVVEALAVADAENERDHSKRNCDGFTQDLVVECRPAAIRLSPFVSQYGNASEADELWAAGRAVANGGDLSLEGFIQKFCEERRAVINPRIDLVVGET